MGKKYPQVYDNEWQSPIHRGYKMACCDCGLVHELDFKIYKKKHVLLRARRNNRSTANIRRHMKRVTYGRLS